MPVTRKFRNTRKRYRSKMPTASLTKKVKKIIKKQRQTNYYGNTENYTNVTQLTTQLVWQNSNSLLVVNEGGGSTERETDKINLIDVRVTPLILFPPKGVADMTLGHNSCIVRMIMYQMKRGFTATQALAELNTSCIGVGARVTIPEVLKFVHILYDKCFYSDHDGLAAYATAQAALTSFYQRSRPVLVRKTIKPPIKFVSWLLPDTSGDPPSVQGDIRCAYIFTNVGGGTVVEKPYVATVVPFLARWKECD